MDGVSSPATGTSSSTARARCSQFPSLCSYLTFSCSPQARAATAASQSRTFSDLVQRCLSTTPSRLELPFNAAEFWSCYRFHNKVRGRVCCHTPSSPA